MVAWYLKVYIQVFIHKKVISANDEKKFKYKYIHKSKTIAKAIKKSLKMFYFIHGSNNCMAELNLEALLFA